MPILDDDDDDANIDVNTLVYLSPFYVTYAYTHTYTIQHIGQVKCHSPIITGLSGCVE